MWLGDLVRRHLAEITPISDEQAAAFDRHYDLLLHWNAKINLTTITELHEASIRHYCESVFVALHITGGGPIADIGSGPGFPGLPVAIMHPDWRVDLIESHQRKAVFLREAARDLPNVRVVAARAESIRDSYQWLISRAVAPESLKKLRLAPNLAVLCSEGDAAVLEPTSVIRLPWGENRVLAIRST